MTKNELIEALKASRTVLPDKTALENINLYPTWESVIGCELTESDISNGYDRYQYGGKLYRLIQAHTPQADWTPDQTPALWEEIQLSEYQQVPAENLEDQLVEEEIQEDQDGYIED